MFDCPELQLIIIYANYRNIYGFIGNGHLSHSFGGCIPDMFEMQPIGYIQSLFTFKNGTPRQSSICQHARGSLTIEKSVFNNPEHSLEGLESFSHVWIIFVFHKNNNQYTKAKVKPPRLNGKRVGLFSTRCPYRPNPIGLTLAKIDKIQGATVHLSGIDLLDGTPVLDIKPYIPDYDCPKTVAMENTGVAMETICASENDYTGNVQNTQSVDSELVNIPSNTTEESENVMCTENISSDTETTDIFCDHAETNFHCDNAKISIHCDHGHKERDIKSNDLLVNQMDFFGSGKLSHESKNLDNSENCTDNFRQVAKSTGHVGQEVVKIMSEGDFERDAEYRQDISSVNINNGSEIFINKNQDILNCETKSENNTDGSRLLPRTINDCNKTITLKNRNASCGQDMSKSENTVYGQTETAGWVQEPPINKLIVRFTNTANEQLKHFSPETEDMNYRLRFLNDIDEAKSAISDILREDPRSVYRRKKCEDSLYFFTVDVLHVTCWFDINMAEVVRIKPITFVQHCNKTNT